jgi:hypothetical protein
MNIKRNPKTLGDLTFSFPPFWVVALAKKKVEGRWRRGMTLMEINELSGISYRKLGRLAPKLTWENETVKTIDAFCAACSFSFFNTAKEVDYIRKTLSGKNGKKFSHLTKSQRETLYSRCQKWMELNKITAAP